MPCDGTEFVEDDELLYRRIPSIYYQSGISPEAFKPNKNDSDGLSLTRAKYHSVEDAARGGRPGKTYFVAVFRAADLRAIGIEIAADPQPGIIGHTLLTNINSKNRKSKESGERIMAMRQLCIRVDGPFATPETDDGHTG
jgi:hypothetical protein